MTKQVETITPLAAIQRILDNGEDAWEFIVSLAHSAEVDTMAHRFLLGDLALLVRKQYGRNRMGDFATKANIARSTMAQYKSVSSFYPEEVREEYTTLAYSQFRDAMRLKEHAYSFLDECASNQWTIEQCKVEVTKRLGKPTPPMKILDVEGCLSDFDALNGGLVLMVEPGADLGILERYLHKSVHIKIYEMEGE